MSDDRPANPVEIGWICVDCRDPGSLANWWQAMVGGEISVDDDGDRRLEGGPVPILFLQVPEEKTVKNRLHFDLRVEDYEGAITKAIDLGAEPAPEVFVGEAWHVLRDPEGNEFCIIRPKHEPG
jgi:hypothetical protein